MIAVIQRVTNASVMSGAECIAQIDKGMLVLLGIGYEDEEEDIGWLTKKIVNLRIFDDVAGVMNMDIKESGGDILLVSQFTLHASVRKGNRPSYIKAARPEVSFPLYERFITALEKALGNPIKTGRFGSTMRVQLVNDGPTTILIDTKNKQ